MQIHAKPLNMIGFSCLPIGRSFGSLLVWHLMHSVVAEVPVQFEVLALLTLRVEGKASLTEVVVNARTSVFAPAVLAPVISRFHDFSLVDKSSRVLPGNVARRFSDGMKRDRERFPKDLLHINNFVRDLLTTVVGSKSFLINGIF